MNYIDIYCLFVFRQYHSTMKYMKFKWIFKVLYRVFQIILYKLKSSVGYRFRDSKQGLTRNLPAATIWTGFICLRSGMRINYSPYATRNATKPTTWVGLLNNGLRLISKSFIVWFLWLVIWCRTSRTRYAKRNGTGQYSA